MHHKCGSDAVSVARYHTLYPVLFFEWLGQSDGESLLTPHFPPKCASQQEPLGTPAGSHPHQ
eukprot:4966669-Heterocapsa_arctica.AAC.1